jgi:hypothetical protein
VFDGVFGIDISRDESDRHVFKMRKDWREFEVALMHTKWFDYRSLTAAQATYLFAHHYRSAFRTMYHKHIDHVRAEYIRALKHEDLFACDAGVVSGIWRARQHADAMCIPYDVYLTDALDTAMNVHRTHLPRPTQLYTDRIVANVQNRWVQRQRSRLYVAESALYRNQHYRGLPSQNDHHEWLFTQIDLRANRSHWIERFVSDDLLPLSKIKARYGEEAVENLPVTA